LGQHERAIAEFQTTLKLQPSTKEAMINIASNYQSMGDCNSAITWYEKYLDSNPSSAKAADVRSRIAGLKRQASKEAQSPNSQTQPDYLADAAPNGQVNRWPAQKIPLRVFIASGTNASGFQESHLQALREAFSKWSQATDGRLAFMPVNDPSQADIVCDWTDDPEKVVQAGRAVEGGLTKLSLQPNGSEIAVMRATVTLLTNRGGTPLGEDEMKKVCLHEVGHALGLNGHSNNSHDIMFYSESPSIWPALTKRDKATMLRLYSDYPPAAQ
jgi:predicted Zn-dependent protease